MALVSLAYEWTSICGNVYRFFFLSDDRPGSSNEKRVSVLIGNHQPIGVAQTKRVSVPIGSQLIGTAQMKRARLRHDNHRSHGSEE